MSALAIEAHELGVEFPGPAGPIEISRAVSLQVAPGRTLGIVGESGSGKSMTLRALCGLIPTPGRVSGGTIAVDGEDVSPEHLERLRGHGIAMIFQDPERSLNPVWSVGSQLREVLRSTRGLDRTAARKEAVALLDQVGIVDPGRRVDAYPHELSGGMRQRVTIALALASQPRLLLADEPTTALDVTTQEQILRLLIDLQRDTGMAMILVTHDLGVVADACDEVVVMYAGSVVERGLTEQVVRRPRHPYTRGLLAAMPRIEVTELPEPIPGQPPDFDSLPAGCPFQPRCPQVRAECAGVDMERESQTTCACPFTDESVEVAA